MRTKPLLSNGHETTETAVVPAQRFEDYNRWKLFYAGLCNGAVKGFVGISVFCAVRAVAK
jgi:hypothetical protein